MDKNIIKEKIKQSEYSKMFIQFKNSNKLFLTSIIFSLIFLFISYDGQIINVLNNTVIENIFINTLSNNVLIFNFTLGYLVSCIFYFIVVYMPEIKNQIRLEKYLVIKLNRVIQSTNSIFISLLKDQDLENINLTKSKLKEICKSINHKEKNVLFIDNGKIGYMSLGMNIYNQWNLLEENLKVVEDFLVFLSKDTSIKIIKELETFKNTTLKFSIHYIVHENKNTNLEVWSDEFWALLLKGNELAEYCINTYDKEFKNPLQKYFNN